MVKKPVVPGIKPDVRCHIKPPFSQDKFSHEKIVGIYNDSAHGKNKRIRALMHIHTQFLVCESCHIQDKPGMRIVYKWYNPLTDNPQGPFYDTGYYPENDMLMKGVRSILLAGIIRKITKLHRHRAPRARQRNFP